MPKAVVPSRPVAATKLLAVPMQLKGGDELNLTAKVGKGKLEISLMGESYTVKCDELPDSFHIGFTACEGICEFGEFSVKEN